MVRISLSCFPLTVGGSAALTIHCSRSFFAFYLIIFDFLMFTKLQTLEQFLHHSRSFNLPFIHSHCCNRLFDTLNSIYYCLFHFVSFSVRIHFFPPHRPFYHCTAIITAIDFLLRFLLFTFSRSLSLPLVPLFIIAISFDIKL